VVAKARQWLIEELSAHHDRAGFSCGHESLDDCLRQYAGQNQRLSISKTFVAVTASSRAVCGYYSLAAGSVLFEHLTDAQRKGLPRYPIPVAHLGRLAVDRDSQGQGLGAHLLIDALARISRIDRELDIHAVEVVAIDDAARKFYLKYGFTPLKDDSHHLFLSLKTIRKLGLTS
jgi:GNAT superfamily N-acetyltransferase